MSRSEYVINMIDAFVKNDRESFYEDCLDLIKHEEKSGNHKIAKKMSSVLNSKSTTSQKRSIKPQGTNYDLFTPNTPVQKDELNSFSSDPQNSNLKIIEPEFDLSDVILNESTFLEVFSFVKQWKRKEILLKYNLTPQDKLLIHGVPGTGKTMITNAIAKELNLPLVYLNFDSLLSSYLGQTSANLGETFKYISTNNCILLIDELDAIAKKRSDSNDLGELKRIVISLLQNLDSIQKGSIVIACTNYLDIIDKAVQRRFDKVIQFELPDLAKRKVLISKYLSKYNLNNKYFPLYQFASISENFTPNDIEKSISNAARNWAIEGEEISSFKHYFLVECLNLIDLENTSIELKVELAQHIRKISRRYSLQSLSKLLYVPKSTLHKKIKEREVI